MSSILGELYHGNISPMEQIVRDDPEYFPLGKKIDAEFESLKQKLCSEDIERVERIITDGFKLSGMSEYAGFTYGMRLGTRLMCELFSGAKW